MKNVRLERFGASFRAVRVALGLSQGVFAMRIGRSQAYVSLVELGWKPTEVVPVALLLSTEVNDDRLRANATSIGQTFPGRWRDLMATVKGAGGGSRGWAIALVDPRSRVRHWCRPTVLDGRRSAAPYRNIADFLRTVR